MKMNKFLVIVCAAAGIMATQIAKADELNGYGQQVQAETPQVVKNVGGFLSSAFQKGKEIAATAGEKTVNFVGSASDYGNYKIMMNKVNDAVMKITPADPNANPNLLVSSQEAKVNAKIEYCMSDSTKEQKQIMKLSGLNQKEVTTACQEIEKTVGGADEFKKFKEINIKEKKAAAETKQQANKGMDYIGGIIKTKF